MGGPIAYSHYNRRPHHPSVASIPRAGSIPLVLHINSLPPSLARGLILSCFPYLVVSSFSPLSPLSQPLPSLLRTTRGRKLIYVPHCTVRDVNSFLPIVIIPCLFFFSPYGGGAWFHVVWGLGAPRTLTSRSLRRSQRVTTSMSLNWILLSSMTSDFCPCARKDAPL